MANYACDLGYCDVGVSITEGGAIYLVLVTCQTLCTMAILTTLWAGQLFYFVDKTEIQEVSRMFQATWMSYELMVHAYQDVSCPSFAE